MVLKVKKILLIDDTESIRTELAFLLTIEGLLTLEARNYFQAMQLIEKKFPDLIICDIFTPYPEGFDFIKQLQKNIFTKKIPIILLTTTFENGIKKILCFSANDYMIKPFDPETLAEFIWEIISTRNSKVKVMAYLY
jgi:CheY-like chemotaxis protein